MDTVKDVLNFCNAAVCYDCTNIGITYELNQVRKCIFNSFYNTIPHTRIHVKLSIIDNKFLKINNNDIENILENIHDLRENMLSYEKLVTDEQHKVKEPLSNDYDDERKNITQKSHILNIIDIIKLVEKDNFYYINGNNKRCYARNE